MQKITVMLGLFAAGLSAPLHAGDMLDPVSLLTHEVCAETTYYVIDDSEAWTFSPASSLAECAHSQVGDYNCARLLATTQCLDPEAEIDLVSFEWMNQNMHSDMFGFTATGTASTKVSLASDAIISLKEIENIDMLSDSADWSIELYDHEDTLIGSLGDGTNTLSLTKDLEYELVFTIGGLSTLTTDGSTVNWGIHMEYAGDFGVVPGAGGLALILGFGRRPRRRRTAVR